MELHLNLIGEYFHQIKDGTKKFEYRRCDKYWGKRLIGKDFTEVVIKWGYPKRDQVGRVIRRPWRGYEIQTIQHEHFGPVPVTVYAIRVN